MVMWRSGRKLLLLLVIVAALVTIVVMERRYADSLLMTMELSPNPAPADGAANIKITVTVTEDDGTPREGDVIFVLPGFGQISPYRQRTNANGKAYFSYRMWTAGLVHGAEDVWFRAINESNSRIIAVPAVVQKVLHVVLPEGDIDRSNVMTPENMFFMDTEEDESTDESE
jgi:hypothetical protein